MRLFFGSIVRLNLNHGEHRDTGRTRRLRAAKNQRKTLSVLGLRLGRRSM